MGAILADVACVSVAVVAAAAVACTPASERPRVAWLLLPLSIAFAVSGVFFGVIGLSQSWFVIHGLLTLGSLCWLLGAFAVTYALLKRRVLDFEFVLSRTLVVGIVSLIVVAAFVLLEWLLGSVLTGVSHTTSLIANAGLALVIGLSLHFVHKRVDHFVDTVMFYKRRNDERALRDFSSEAMFMTERDALFDQAMANIRNHTDAQASALFVQANGVYTAVRRFGDAAAEVSENDPAILALKAWHKPLDTHHYATGLHGVLALPMVSRGQLLGVLLCGERARGEAYAPDQVEALCAFAHGVGSAVDGLRDGASRDGASELLGAIHKLGDDIATLHASLNRLLSDHRTLP